MKTCILCLVVISFFFLPGCNGDDGAASLVDSDVQFEMKRQHLAYSALAKRGGHDVSFAVQEYQQVPLSDLDAAHSRIMAETQVPKVIPYIAVLSNRSPHSWLDAHLVDISLVSQDKTSLAASTADKLAEMKKGSFASAWELMIKLSVDGETMDYKAFALKGKGADAKVSVIDPVVFGLDLNSHQMKPYHVTPGANSSSTWTGCWAAQTITIRQAAMLHVQGKCTVTGWCTTPATAKIMCDTAKKDCPRKTGATIPSGTCAYTRTKACVGTVNLSTKGDTVVQGNCQHSAVAEMMYGGSLIGGSAIKWSIKLKSSKGSVTPTVTFQGKTPSHAVYQFHLATLCCEHKQKPDAGVDPTGDYGVAKDGGMDGGPFQKCKGLTPSKCVLCCEVEAQTDAEFNTCVKLHCK